MTAPAPVDEPYNDDEYISACLGAHGAHPYVRWALPSNFCGWCGHPTHGLGCGFSSACHCEGSFTSRDDSWRPATVFIATTPTQFMHDTGVDGYTATAVCGWNVRPNFSPLRIRNILLGKAAQ